MRETDFSLLMGSGSDSPPQPSVDSSSLRCSVSRLKYRGERAQVATNVAYSSGGRQACSARLPSGSIPTR
jgi:hypothetical protein